MYFADSLWETSLFQQLTREELHVSIHQHHFYKSNLHVGIPTTLVVAYSKYMLQVVYVHPIINVLRLIALNW